MSYSGPLVRRSLGLFREPDGLPEVRPERFDVVAFRHLGTLPGGAFEIGSRPGTGTPVRCSLPVTLPALTMDNEMGVQR